MLDEKSLYERRRFIYTSESIMPSDTRGREKDGWKIVERMTITTPGRLPTYILIIERPKAGWPKAKERKKP